jgi:hypothetical protein
LPIFRKGQYLIFFQECTIIPYIKVKILHTYFYYFVIIGIAYGCGSNGTFNNFDVANYGESVFYYLDTYCKALKGKRKFLGARL